METTMTKAKATLKAGTMVRSEGPDGVLVATKYALAADIEVTILFVNDGACNVYEAADGTVYYVEPADDL